MGSAYTWDGLYAIIYGSTWSYTPLMCVHLIITHTHTHTPEFIQVHTGVLNFHVYSRLAVFPKYFNLLKARIYRIRCHSKSTTYTLANNTSLPLYITISHQKYCSTLHYVLKMSVCFNVMSSNADCFTEPPQILSVFPIISFPTVFSF